MAVDDNTLQEFFMVDEIAAAMEWLVVPTMLVEGVRELKVVASNPDSSPDDVLKGISKVQTAIGARNLVAIVAHDLWDDWCPSPENPDQHDNKSGVVIWAGKRGYVKFNETDADGRLDLVYHAVRK